MSRRWLMALPPARFAEERLYARETVTLDLGTGGRGDGDLGDGDLGDPDRPRAGDPVVLLAAEPPVLVGLGRVRPGPGDGVVVRYTHRLFDTPVPVDDVAAVRRLPPAGLGELTEEEYAQLFGRVDASRRVDADRAGWLVSLALPIEASTAAEAVREFWTYVDKLGPRELPAFVWPIGDELAMQAFVLGERATLDPEED